MASRRDSGAGVAGAPDHRSAPQEKRERLGKKEEKRKKKGQHRTDIDRKRVNLDGTLL
jgi:hypothetical protein